jgi:ectoine hydroxylase-related dioxygenase (phytanoyl-CoA dioxygenase family)
LSNNSSLDPRLHLPYSIGTGIPKGGNTEIAGYLDSLRTQGFCAIEGVIPREEVEEVRESVLLGRRLLEQDRLIEKQKRVELEKERLVRDGKSAIEITEPVRPPVAPNAELCDISRNEIFAKYLAESRVLRVAKAIMDPHARILQTEVNKSSRPTEKPVTEEQKIRRGWHSDWPHDLSAYGPTENEPWNHCGAVGQPFPDVCMALSTIWFLGPEDVTPYNGGTWVVPCSHKDPRNPRGPDDGIDDRAPIPGEFQISVPAGSVFIQDTRIWHSNALNQSAHERTAVVVRYGPWWLSGNEFGNLHSGGKTINTYVPKDVFERFSPDVQLLYRHLAEGVEDVLQPENQRKAMRARFLDQPHLRNPDKIANNDHVIVGAMTAEEWRRNQKNP